MYKKYLLILLLPLALFADEGTKHNYDIVERTINFLIFFGIVYYFIASKIKVAYSQRISSIADKLDSIQIALKNSNKKRELAKEKVQKAQEDAKNLLITSKKETEILIAKMQNDLKVEMQNLEKSYLDKMQIEKRRIKREIVLEIIDELFEKSALQIDRKDFVDIILKKVA